MSVEEMAVLLAEIQLGDNRQVDELTIAYWHNTIGDLDLDAGQQALRRFRRERPGVYLEPGHLLELAGVDAKDQVAIAEGRNFTQDFVRHQVREVLVVLGLTEAQYDADETVRGRVAAHIEQSELEETPAQ